MKKPANKDTSSIVWQQATSNTKKILDNTETAIKTQQQDLNDFILKLENLKELSDSSEHNSSARKSYERLNQRKKTQEKNLRDLEEQLKYAQELSEALTELEFDYQTQARIAAELVSKNDELREQLRLKTNELNQSNIEKDELTDESLAHAETIKKLKSDAQIQKKEIIELSKLHDVIKNLKEEQQKNTNNSDNLLSNLEKELKKVQNEHIKTVTQNTAHEKTIRKQEKELTDLASQNEELKNLQQENKNLQQLIDLLSDEGGSSSKITTIALPPSNKEKKKKTKKEQENKKEINEVGILEAETVIAKNPMQLATESQEATDSKEYAPNEDFFKATLLEDIKDPAKSKITTATPATPPMDEDEFEIAFELEDNEKENINKESKNQQEEISSLLFSTNKPVQEKQKKDIDFSKILNNDSVIKSKEGLSTFKHDTREAVRLTGILLHSSYRLNELSKLSNLDKETAAKTITLFLQQGLVEIIED